MIDKDKMGKVIEDRCCELAGEFAKQVAIKHMKLQFRLGVLNRYVEIAGTSRYKHLDEEGCLEESGCFLGDCYKEQVTDGINSINLDGDIVEGIQVLKFK